MYKQQIMYKLDNILRNCDINEEDQVWIEAIMLRGLHAMKERDEALWELENKMD